MVSFFNSNAPQGCRYIKLTVGGGSGRLILSSNDAAAVVSALTGREVAPGYPVTVEMGLAPGRQLTQQERQALQQAVRASYNAQYKSLDLSSLAAKGNFTFVNFSSNNFTSDLFNAIQAHASDAISIDFSNNQIQSLACFPGLHRVAPNMKNLALKDNQIPKSANNKATRINTGNAIHMRTP